MAQNMDDYFDYESYECFTAIAVPMTGFRACLEQFKSVKCPLQPLKVPQGKPGVILVRMTIDKTESQRLGEAAVVKKRRKEVTEVMKKIPQVESDQIKTLEPKNVVLFALTTDMFPERYYDAFPIVASPGDCFIVVGQTLLLLTKKGVPEYIEKSHEYPVNRQINDVPEDVSKRRKREMFKANRPTKALEGAKAEEEKTSEAKEAPAPAFIKKAKKANGKESNHSG